MSDIVKRLLGWADRFELTTPLHKAMLREAAAEIERLTAARDAAMRVHIEDGEEIERLRRNNDELRAVLKSIERTANQAALAAKDKP